MASFVAYWLRWPSVEYLIEANTWLWPLCEIFHFIGLILLIGAVGTFDLRLIGCGKGLSPRLLGRLLPWGVTGFILCAVATLLALVQLVRIRARRGSGGGRRW